MYPQNSFFAQTARLKTVCLAFILSLCCLPAKATKLDSLLTVWTDTNQPDSSRIKALLKAFRFEWPTKDSIAYYSELGYQFAERTNNTPAMIEVLIAEGIRLKAVGSRQEAIEKFREAYKLSSSTSDNYGTNELLFQLGNIHLTGGGCQAALDYYYDLLKILEQKGPESQLMTCISSIALVHIELEDYEEGIKYLQQCLEYSEKNEKDKGTLTACYNLAVAHHRKGDFQVAIDFLERAKTIAEQQMLGGITIGNILNGIGEAYFELGQTEKANHHFQQAIALLDPENTPLPYALTMVNLARGYQETNADSAFMLANSAYEIFEALQDLNGIRYSTLILSDIYEKQGRYALALEMFKKHKSARDSVWNRDSQEELHQAQIRHEYEKQKLADKITFEQGLAQQQLSAQRQFYLMVGGLALAIIAFLSILKVRKNRSETERNSLLHEIDLLKERVAVQSISNTGIREELKLNKPRIEAHIGNALGESSWNILNTIFETPSISNKEIAERVFLSVEGVSSSLRRMYKTFDVRSENSQNMKVALVTKAVQLSLDESITN